MTPFNKDGSVDYDAIQRIGSWLVTVEGVKGLVVLGHAGEGTFLTEDEQVKVIEAFVKSVDNKIPIIAGITREGDYVAGLEAKRAKEAGAAAGLLYPRYVSLSYQSRALLIPATAGFDSATRRAHPRLDTRRSTRLRVSRSSSSSTPMPPRRRTTCRLSSTSSPSQASSP